MFKVDIKKHQSSVHERSSSAVIVGFEVIFAHCGYYLSTNELARMYYLVDPMGGNVKFIISNLLVLPFFQLRNLWLRVPFISMLFNNLWNSGKI